MRDKPLAMLFAILLAAMFAGIAHAENWAVIVGIDKYQKIRPNLSFCVPDAKLFRDALLKYSGFQPDHIKTLFDEEATKANIKEALLDWLAGNVQPGDKAVFYFSGHGVQMKDINGDEEDGYDEVLVAHDSWLIDTKFIIDEELSRWVGRIPTANKIVILDCCHSGTGTRALDPDVQVRQYYPEKPIEVSQERASEPIEPQFQKSSLLSACDANQVALESKRLGHGVFTYYLSQSLSGLADTDNDGRISIREVANYSVQKIKGDGWEQDPQLEGEYADKYLVGEGELVEPYGVITAIEGGDTFTLALWEKDEATVGSLYAIFAPEAQETEGIGKGLVEILEVGPNESRAKAFKIQGSVAIGDRVVEYQRRFSFENLRLRFVGIDGDDGISEIKKSDIQQTFMEQLGQRKHIEPVTEAEAPADRVLKVQLEEKSTTPVTYRLLTHLVNPQRQTKGPEYALLFSWENRDQAVATILDMKHIGGELEGAYALKRLSKLTSPTRASIGIQLSINKGANGIFNIGDELSITATVDRDCWLTLLDIGSSGNIIVLFPNKYQPDNKVTAGQPIQIPASGYKIRVGGPAGTETIKAFATLDPLDLDELSVENLKGVFNTLDGDASSTFSQVLTSKDLFFEPEARDRWAEANIHFRVAPEQLYKEDSRSVLELSILE